MHISIVVAAAENGAIGKDGAMPWRLSADLKHFKNITWGMPVVMGRKTFESIGKALPGRKNIVLTRQSGWKADNVIPVKTMDDALFIAKHADIKELMVIGGGEIYRSVIDKAKRVYLTRVHSWPDADTFFPELDGKKWTMLNEQQYAADEKNDFAYSFQIWERN